MNLSALFKNTHNFIRNSTCGYRQILAIECPNEKRKKNYIVSLLCEFY